MNLYHYLDSRDQHITSLEARNDAEALFYAGRYGEPGEVQVLDSAWCEVMVEG